MQRNSCLFLCAVLAAACAAPARAPQRGPELDPAILAETAPAVAWQRIEVQSMATVFELVLPGDASATAAAQAAVAAILAVESSANEWRDDSPLAAVSRAAGGDWLPVSADLWDLLALSRDLAERTGGAFDPTWAALWGLWDFQPGAAPRLPSPEQVAQRVARIGWRDLQLRREATAVRLARPQMVLGLGGIAKGWALDRAAAALRARGQGNFLLSAGGQVLAGGRQGDQPWRVGLRHPRFGMDPQAPAVWASLVLHDGESLATSADSERGWVLDGVRYHHILDPRTGWPAGHGRRDWPWSVAVLARGGAVADALSTAAMVLGPDAAARLEPLWLAAFTLGPQGAARHGSSADRLQVQ
ncbi:MAG: FAD:protein FMN transferase [Deltaproteobacteria bacterium]|nr:FAD:protein FMN transferase [Deltaproteobacteria bacterium]